MRPRRPERLFFALLPDAKTAMQIATWSKRFLRENSLEGTLLRKDRLHVSLHHVGDYRRLRSPLVYAARLAGNAVALAPFTVTFTEARSLPAAPSRGGEPRRRPLVLMAESVGLRALHEGLGLAMRNNGLRAADVFTPHMTLAYGPDAVPARPIEPINFTAAGFALIHSALGLTRYAAEAQWALRG